MTDAEHTKLAGIAAGAEVNVQSNWTQTNTSADDYIKNKPTLATVATSGSYNDLQDKPNIPAGVTVDQTITQNGTNPVQGGAIYSALQRKTEVEHLTFEYDDVEDTFTFYDSEGNTITDAEFRDICNSKYVFLFDAGNGVPLAPTKLEMDSWWFTGNLGITDGVIVSFYWSSSTNNLDGNYSYNETVPTNRKINNKALSSDITLNASDIGALPASTTIPSKTSDLTNDSGFTSNAGTITGITMNGASKGTSGVVDLGTVITAHQDISGKANASDVYTKTQTDTLLSGKQNTLTFDSTPTASSTNPVTSGGVKTYVDGKATITGITTSQDGTFTIAQSDGNSYTLNLNHTHEGMAKLVKCTEATLPQTMADDTIYVQVDDLTTPTAIESLYIFGLEFTGGGGGAEPELHYDAEIEYLQSTGAQYINTGILPSTYFECEIKAEFTQNQQGFDTLLGSASGNNFSVALAISGSDLHASYTQFGRGSAVSSVKTLGLHTYHSSLKNNVIKINVDGIETSGNLAGTISNNQMYLFARNKGSGTIGNYSMAKVYYCKIWSGENLVFDAIPVRVGTTGYMYDNVSGTLLGNLGSDSFTLGNDKS